MGIKIGILLNLSPYLIGLLGRITNMITCMLLITLGIKLIPIGKKVMSIILLAPSIISYNSSLSADGLIIATTFLLVSLVIKFMYEKTKMNWKWYILLLVIVAFVSTCKAAYLPIIGILIFIPYECFKNKKNKWIYTISLILFGITFSLLWISVGNIVIPNSGEITGIHKYIHFVVVLINTLSRDFMSYIENIFAGDYMYQRQLAPYRIIPATYIVITILSIFNEKSDLKVRTIEKVILATISLMVIALIAYALFTGNTAATEHFINGIQGRYFVPILLFIPFFMKNSRFKIKEENLFDISLILNFAVLTNMIQIFVI